MPSLTVRNISEELLEKIRVLSISEKRSLNNEVLAILEKGLQYQINEILEKPSPRLSKSVQTSLWSELSGKWQDSRSSNDIIAEIYSARTFGRDVEL